MKIISFNISDIRSRLHQLTKFSKKTPSKVMVIQKGMVPKGGSLMGGFEKRANVVASINLEWMEKLTGHALNCATIENNS